MQFLFSVDARSFCSSHCIDWLDWFEVDLGFNEFSFIQIDLCVLCVFVLYSRVSLSSCPFLDIVHGLPRAVGVLQCVAVCCSLLQCVAVCCSVSQCVAVCCRMLQCVAVCRSVLQCVAVYMVTCVHFVYVCGHVYHYLDSNVCCSVCCSACCRQCFVDEGMGWLRLVVSLKV